MSNIPSEFVCPITMVLMKDPYIAGDGYTYEKEAITTWLQTNTKSPMTREPMLLNTCRPNRALKDAIERWQKETPKKKKTQTGGATAPSLSVTPQSNYGTTIESDHMYAIMIQAQETLEQIKKSPQQTQVVSQQQIRQTIPMTDEQRRKYAVCLFFFIGTAIILIIVIDKINSNMS